MSQFDLSAPLLFHKMFVVHISSNTPDPESVLLQIPWNYGGRGGGGGQSRDGRGFVCGHLRSRPGVKHGRCSLWDRGGKLTCRRGAVQLCGCVGAGRTSGVGGDLQ